MKRIKGYKAFSKDLTCRDFQFKVGETYTHNSDITLCREGFHFCLVANDVFKYYDFAPETRVCEVEALGEVHGDGNKRVTNKIKIVREIPKLELLTIINSGKENTGRGNSGDENSGHLNSGHLNSGHYNSGHYNSGDKNSGDRNSGPWNSGDKNSGDRNSGNRNSGNYNSGDYNSGPWNSGNYNSGDENSGHLNSGTRNSGDENSGHLNSGHLNSGDENSGDRNSGNRNSGRYNSGNYNSGFFNTDEPTVRLFNKQTKIKRSDPRIKAILSLGPITTEWILFENMTEIERSAYPKAETTNGYLKTIPYKEAWAKFWSNATNETKQKFLDLPNFNAKIFFEITGIDVRRKQK